MDHSDDEEREFVEVCTSKTLISVLSEEDNEFLFVNVWPDDTYVLVSCKHLPEELGNHLGHTTLKRWPEVRDVHRPESMSKHIWDGLSLFDVLDALGAITRVLTCVVTSLSNLP